jgi:hypothetical protein
MKLSWAISPLQIQKRAHTHNQGLPIDINPSRAIGCLDDIIPSIGIGH